MAERRDKKSKMAALADLRRAREGGPRTLKEEEDAPLYDEVTEDQYKRIVKGRLQRDDFVVDDGVDGYMDDGMDDWGGEQDYVSESDDDKKHKKSKKSSKKDASKGKAKAKPVVSTVAPSINDYRPVKSVEQEDDFMASLLGDMEAIPSRAPEPSSRKRKTRETYASPPTRYRDPFPDTSSDGFDTSFAEPSEPSDDDHSPKKKVRTAGAVTPDVDRMAKLDFESDFEMLSEDDLAAELAQDDIDVKPALIQNTSKAKKVAKPDPDAPPSWLSVYDNLNVASADSLGPINTAVASSTNASKISALQDDGSLRFFWIDYLELDGRIYFVGKLKDRNTGAWVSCCITVENLERNVYVLPRQKRVETDENGDIYETDEVPQVQDVYKDFDAIRKHAQISSFKGKFVQRKYAFDDPDVPREDTQWMKVIYPFTEPEIHTSTKSAPNIAKIFGTNTSAFELLVLKRKIMGPCWLQIKNPEINYKGVSWCKLEAIVSDPKDINPFSETDPEAPKEMPPLTVTSLSLRTVVNHRENKQELVCITSRTWHNMVIDDPTPPEKLPATVQTWVRPLDKFPANFEKQAKSNGRGTITPVVNERMMLNSLLVSLQKVDPDVIVGHEFSGVTLDVLLGRMKELKADHWSRIGRFRRSRWPNIGKQGSNIKFLAGRLMCDLASDAAKSMVASTTWSLTEMCKTHLKSDREDIDPDDTASYLDGTLDTPDRFMTFVRHGELDAHYFMAIAAKVQMLPLTKQLTNLAGNSWNKTLNGGRAERNEYILLHEFHRLKYICPDKMFGKKYGTKVEPGDGEDKTKKSKKYKGGLVFPPKKGLWDKYILVMDFNSLYPSIIQEYNIDFTTIDRIEEAEDENGEQVQPEPPSPDVPQGVLPRLIATLVNRRRQVKSLLKDKSATAAQLLQWDIKQQALKLTANSMYGCLGFEYSRFYARQLASLTTYKGREIITHTKELAESLSLDVVYGDTDSVFVNSNVTELPEALKISATFKKAVNEQYKLLEIDLDSVFQRLLLLQKKKYAAVKVEDGTRTSVEIKGLDMKRREYCALSKRVSQYVLDQILSGEATDSVVENIHEYLATMDKSIRNGKVMLDDFIVFKRLGKNPEDYPKTEGQPHVAVALRMKARGASARAGDVIPYVFCMTEDGGKGLMADRVHHPDELRRADSTLRIDYEHYLSNQILPPVERLCEPIQGTDRARLAECLGLDPMRYKSTAAGQSDEVSFAALDSQKSDAERYKDAVPFAIRCRSCTGESTFAPLADRQMSIVTSSGPRCTNEACEHREMSTASLQMQLESQIRGFISRFYEGWVTCDDSTCDYRTRMMSVSGHMCLRDKCGGRTSFEYDDAMLYMQLRYFASLFNPESILKSAKGPVEHDALNVLVHQNAEFLSQMLACVEKYLDRCGRRWVDMASIFSFIK